ncbi:MAG TPA: flagellar motor stator protein MotA [Bryobacteraceae bacterium]|jgi:chemotaxis protein MotA|nr:flagellar motor stator protein MotA [Bryobacteraceae bacterium]
MFAIIGILVVIGSIVGGYLMEHGQILVLLQPAEILIIMGAAAGTILIANPLSTVMKLLTGIKDVFFPHSRDKKFYLENLKMLYDLFTVARKNGLPKLEADMDDPEKSAVFSKYPAFLKNKHALYFVCDTLRMFIGGGIETYDLDNIMELDLEVQHSEEHAPISALTSTADSLPGLGIVAAVLGVVITMGALGGPPDEIGKKVAAALVGTFLGILMCYGFLGPMAAKLTLNLDEEGRYFNVLRLGILSFCKGAPPITATEFARRGVPSSVRPTFQELEAMCRGTAASDKEKAAAA